MMSSRLSVILFVAVAVGFGWSLLGDLRQGKIRVANFFVGQTYAEKTIDPLVYWGVFALKAVLALVILISLGSNFLRR